MCIVRTTNRHRSTVLAATGEMLWKDTQSSMSIRELAAPSGQRPQLPSLPLNFHNIPLNFRNARNSRNIGNLYNVHQLLADRNIGQTRSKPFAIYAQMTWDPTPV